MSQQLHSELKKEFQLERFVLFSDAVFAIAITLLVLEIKVPPIDRHIATDALLIKSLEELIPKFIGFFLSFFIIGLYWTIHHRMFGFVVDFTPKLLRLNLVFLLAVVLMPFSTAFYSEYILRLLKTPMVVYVTNIAFLGFTNFFLWRYVSNPKNHLSEGISREERFSFSFRAILFPCMFIFSAIVYLFVDRRFAVWVLPVIAVIIRIVRNRFRKKPQIKQEQ